MAFKKRGSVFSTQIFTFFMGSSVRNALLIALLTPSFSLLPLLPTWKNSFCQFDDDLECPVVVFAAFTFKAKTTPASVATQIYRAKASSRSKIYKVRNKRLAKLLLLWLQGRKNVASDVFRGHWQKYVAYFFKKDNTEFFFPFLKIDDKNFHSHLRCSRKT